MLLLALVSFEPNSESFVILVQGHMQAGQEASWAHLGSSTGKLACAAYDPFLAVRVKPEPTVDRKVFQQNLESRISGFLNSKAPSFEELKVLEPAC